MRGGVLLVSALFLLVGFGGDGHQTQLPQLTREEAAALAVAAARSERDPVEVTDFNVRRGRVLVGTWKSTNSTGGEAWLSIFRLTGSENDPDQACIWDWRSTGGPDPYGFEEVPSVGWGRASDPIHERCWAEVRTRGIAGPDQAGGSEIPEQPVSAPDLVGVFGPRPAGLYPLTDSGGSAMTLTAQPLDLPAGMTPGTCGVAGFVIDERTERPVSGATVAVTPSHAWSGVSDTRTIHRPGAATAVSDERGAFAVGGLPDAGEGLDVIITATGYGPAQIVHEDCAVGDFMVGDWPIDHGPTLEDATPRPVGR